MDNSPNRLPLTMFLFSLLLATFLLTPDQLSGSTGNSNSALMPQNMPVELDFEYPDQVDAGSSFTFSIKLKKEGGYDSDGKILCEFSGGLLPVESDVSNADFTFDGRYVTISWETLGNSNIFHFPIKVSTGKNQGGVYPVKIRYLDNTGLELKRNVGIFIYNVDEVIVPPVTGPDAENPFRVNLEFPDEILFDESYRMDIVISKGKNTGEAKVFMQLPPASQITIPDYPEHSYKQEKGSLYISLSSMPVSPSFTITCNVKNTVKVKSVYPVRATVEFANGSRIEHDDFILVTDKKTAGRGDFLNVTDPGSSENAAINADTTKLFNEMNKLLENWTESTGRITQAQPAMNSESQNKKQNPQVNEVLSNEVVFYSVQFVASEVEIPGIENQLKSKGIDERILEDYDGKIYRYTVGDFETQHEAKSLKKELLNKGYPDAFIVEYVNGIRNRSFY